MIDNKSITSHVREELVGSTLVKALTVELDEMNVVITISAPVDLIKQVNEAASRRGRSDFIRQAIEAELERLKEEAAIQNYLTEGDGAIEGSAIRRG
jgi:hypothetical protein